MLVYCRPLSLTLGDFVSLKGANSIAGPGAIPSLSDTLVIHLSDDSAGHNISPKAIRNLRHLSSRLVLTKKMFADRIVPAC
ncbi:MAG: hypothetical protein RLY14_3043 [Planctomycetota bacterium]|jgi:hypothetical protein